MEGNGLIDTWMTKIFGTSWQTTFAGILLGILVVIVPILQSGRMPSSTEWTTAVAVAVLGILSKYSKKTGV